MELVFPSGFCSGFLEKLVSEGGGECECPPTTLQNTIRADNLEPSTDECEHHVPHSLLSSTVVVIQTLAPGGQVIA
ncbi:hypothetical protein STEG23_029060, partial [Scotinomys teguina]